MTDFGVYLTPEQVAERLQLGTETVYRYLRKGKLRGSRISHKAWRISEMNLASFMKEQNVSELLFEQYLDEQGLGRADHEPEFPGATKRVDYRLLHNSERLWFEVKEFADDMGLFSDASGGSFDGYAAIRGKINKASEKFRDYDGECCSLVLFNESANLARIDSPSMVMGAMLGNLSFRVAIDIEARKRAGPTKSFFGDGGRMINPHTKAPHNTTISAVIALERLPVGQRECRIRMAREELNGPRQLSWDEMFEMSKPTCPAEERLVLRTAVYENPYARVPLPADIFSGPFDERWGPGDGQMIAKYVGAELSDLVRREQELDLHLGPLQLYLKREKERAMRNGEMQ
jgi:excisionase family DNA binding protein